MTNFSNTFVNMSLKIDDHRIAIVMPNVIKMEAIKHRAPIFQ